MAYGFWAYAPLPSKRFDIAEATRHDPYPTPRDAGQPQRIEIAEYLQSFSTQKSRRDTCRSPKLHP